MNVTINRRLKSAIAQTGSRLRCIFDVSTYADRCRCIRVNNFRERHRQFRTKQLPMHLIFYKSAVERRVPLLLDSSAPQDLNTPAIGRQCDHELKSTKWYSANDFTQVATAIPSTRKQAVRHPFGDVSNRSPMIARCLCQQQLIERVQQTSDGTYSTRCAQRMQCQITTACRYPTARWRSTEIKKKRTHNARGKLRAPRPFLLTSF